MSNEAPENTSGIVMALMAVTIGMFGKLVAKGLLTEQEVRDILDNGQLGLEEMGLSNRTARATHGVLEQMRVILVKSAPPPERRGDAPGPDTP